MRWVGTTLGSTLVVVGLVVAGCGSDSDGDSGSGGDGSGNASNGSGGRNGSGGSTSSGGTTEPPAPGECSSVRMTQYASSDIRWCAFDRNHAVLPEFVRQGITVAIAEPYNGSSYEGDPGEACGECWEIDTIEATQIVMVHDLCPIEGNPICAGSHFHFDVSNETAEALGGGWLGEAAVRQVPCPVTGNIHVRVASRNQYGYVQLAFFNHRLPIRSVEYRAADGDTWTALERCNARWCGDDDPFRDSGPGAVFRLTSADSSVDPVETEAFPYSVGDDDVFDTGAQFAEVEIEGGACVFVPPGNVYDEEWGGIDGVRWEPNTWGDVNMTESADGCAESSASCIHLDGFDGSGLHITYRGPFPSDTFSTLSLMLRAESGEGTVEVAPRSEDARCSNPTTVDVGASWTSASIDIATACPDTSEIHGLTISRSSGITDLVVDEIQFE